MRRAPRTDANQAEIVAALRTRGALVQSLAGVGAGVPDLLVGWRGALRNLSGTVNLTLERIQQKLPLK